jgi:hypothetical protein
MKRYMADGSSSEMVGNQNKLIDCDDPNPIYANFTIRGRDFGGVAYDTIGSPNHQNTTIKRVCFDGSWRGFSTIPNGEAGALDISGGTYAIENCDLRSVDGSSPLMWNNNSGGATRNVRYTSRTGTAQGGFTFWHCSGAHTFQNVWLDSSMNIEQNLAGFSLTWNGGRLAPSGSNRFHFGINPENGSAKLTLTGVTIAGNSYTTGAMSVNVYTTTGKQKRSDVTCDTAPVSYLPPEMWI